MEFYAITNKSDTARKFWDSTIDYVFIDLEQYGKLERQPGDTVKNNHQLTDLVRIANLENRGKILLRTDPVNSPSFSSQLSCANRYVVDMVMLPYFTKLGDVIKFDRLLDNEIEANLLIETKEALVIIPQIVEYIKNSARQNWRIHFGLNDLSLSLGLENLFEVLFKGYLMEAVSILNENEVSFGIGGIGLLNGDYAVSAKTILDHHVQYGSTSVILSRAFFATKSSYRKEIDLIRGYLNSKL